MKRIIEINEDYFFDTENAKNYLDDVKSASKTRYSNFLSSTKKLNIKGKYLEIGCGPGVLTQIVAAQHPNADITANDISPEMIKLAQQDLSEDLKERINYTIGDACDINTIKGLGKFDFIYSTFTMHHWNNAETAINNLYSTLNESGMLYIHDLKRVPWLYYIKKQTGFFKSIRASYRPNEIREMLNKLGITHYKIKTVFPFFMQSVLIRK